jgi:hypothetical protein
MAYPTKPYPDYDRTGPGQEGFKFLTRDPKEELTYTSALLKDVLDPNGDWADAELAVGTTLKTRYNDVVTTLNTTARAEYNTILSGVKNDVYGTTNPTLPDVAYSQFLAGMSSAFGGGHSSVALYTQLATQQKQLAVAELARQVAGTTMALTYNATTAMPLVVPIESGLVGDACASAVEATNAGQIRSQQVRQSKAAGAILSAAQPPIVINGPQVPVDEVVMYASIHAQGTAATTT